MAITSLDPHTALIVVDLQVGILALDTCHPTLSVVDNTCQLLEQFRNLQLPIVLVNVAGVAAGRTEQIPSNGERPTNWSQLTEVLQPESKAHLITKRTWGAFTDTGLDEYLKSKGVTQVVITGIATSIGVESTARQAWELGYNITLPTDAMTDFNLDVHHNSVNFIFPRMSETGSTQDVLALMKETFVSSKQDGRDLSY
ncbi:isochorismatase family cysteine hydrolase [Shewanella psychrophila]|nr:isochorismatase family cysteine hydrolase [Shewanella psychrophila]